MAKFILPPLLIAMATYVGWITARGFRNGAMEPIAKGFSIELKRETQPVGFWVSAIWNMLLIGLCLWGAIGSAVNLR